MGMQPVEDFGAGTDPDGDGVTNEILVGEVSALAIFSTNLEPPFQEPSTPQTEAGLVLFNNVGCADCHQPTLETRTPALVYSFPEVEADPGANPYMRVDLRNAPTSFAPSSAGGVVVPAFSDLKRHNLGPDLAEDTGGALDPWYITARLWGIADTAPYMHDGRALTLTAAILAHGGEAQASRDAFEGLNAPRREALLAFLRSLRTPTAPAADLLK